MTIRSKRPTNYLSASEVEEILGVDKEVIKNRIKTGVFPPKYGRYYTLGWLTVAQIREKDHQELMNHE